MEQGITQVSTQIDSRGEVPANFLDGLIWSIEAHEGCKLEESNVILTELPDGSFHRIAESIKE